MLSFPSFLHEFEFCSHSFYPPRPCAPLMPLFSNPQFSDLNNSGSRDLELEWGNCTGMGRQDKTNHSEQILGLILKGQWDRLSPEGKLESHLAECLLALAPAFAGRGRLWGQTEGPSAALFPVCGGARRDRVSLLPHFKLTLRLWPALNTADNTGFIARGW